MEDQEYETRAVLARIAEREAPPIGFTAEGLAARGRRQARTRRVGALAGGAVGVAAVAVAVLPVMVPRSSGEGDPGAPTVVPSTPAVDPVCLADMAKLPQFTDPDSQAYRNVALQVCPLLRRVDTALDPTGTHLRTVDGELRPAPIDIVGALQTSATGAILGVARTDSWTADGHYPKTPAHPEEDLGVSTNVEIFVEAPGLPEPFPEGVADHLPHPGLKAGQAPPAVPWAPVKVVTLADGSTVSETSEQDADGKSYLLIRTLPSGMRLVLFVDGPYGDGAAATPFPYSQAQLVAAVSVPWDGKVGLPLRATQVPSTKTGADPDQKAPSATRT